MSGCTDGGSHNDQDEFDNMQRAMDELHLDGAERDRLYRTVAAVLHLGNIVFEADGDTGSTVSNQPSSRAALADAARLLRCDAAALERGLTQSTQVVGQRGFTRAFTPARDGWC